MKKLITAVGIGAPCCLSSSAAMADAKNPKIGFSIDDLRLERWTRDRDYFIAAAEKLGAKVYVQSADASEQRQIAQIENLISRGVDVLVIVPYNATVLNNADPRSEEGQDQGAVVRPPDPQRRYRRLHLVRQQDRGRDAGRRRGRAANRRAITTCWAARRPTTTPRCCAKAR